MQLELVSTDNNHTNSSQRSKALTGSSDGWELFLSMKVPRIRRDSGEVFNSLPGDFHIGWSLPHFNSLYLQPTNRTAYEMPTFGLRIVSTAESLLNTLTIALQYLVTDTAAPNVEQRRT